MNPSSNFIDIFDRIPKPEDFAKAYEESLHDGSEHRANAIVTLRDILVKLDPTHVDGFESLKSALEQAVVLCSRRSKEDYIIR